MYSKAKLPLYVFLTILIMCCEYKTKKDTPSINKSEYTIYQKQGLSNKKNQN